MNEVTTHKLVVPGPMPGLNELIGASNASRYKYNQLKKQWTQIIAAAGRKSRWQPEAVTARADFTWVEASRRRDPDNIAAGGRKLLFDTLVELGAWQNDGWAQVGGGWSDSFTVDKQQPRVEVIFHPINEGEHDGKRRDMAGGRGGV